MTNPLFSTYSQGENRVTGSLLAVFERISFALVAQILQQLLEEPESDLLTFTNQPTGTRTTPDAKIAASFSYWIETKTDGGALQREQLLGHLETLDEAADFHRTQRLLVLTPDASRPDVIDEIDDERMAWASFSDLAGTIDAVVEPGEDLVSGNEPLATERERELLRELVQFLAAEDRLEDASDRVVVVAARRALGEYLRHSVYICQRRRSFRPCERWAFCKDGAIDVHIPKVLETVEAVTLSREAVDGANGIEEGVRQKLRSLINALDEENSERLGTEQKVVFLSDPESEETIQLGAPIPNDLTAESGPTVPFTCGQRYTSLHALQEGPRTTSKLVDGR